ncbi:MAG TPA: Fe-S cluster assembly protein SufD [Burkholderiaceae bacterium]|nr:Fe-S cluster assembly protein SufD [Burkholderiaceae bacterium]
MSAAEPWSADFQARADGLFGAAVPWLAGTRRRAMDRFVAEGWPTTKQEKWHHTTLAALGQTSFTAAVGTCTRSRIEQLRHGDAGHWLVFVDGRHAPELSDIGTLPEGVELGPLSREAAERPERLESCLGTESDGSSVAALNLALASDGAFVRIGRGCELDAPVHLVFVAAAENGAGFVRNVILAEPGAHATVVEHYLGEGAEASLTSTVTRTVVAADAHLTHLKLQQESPQAFHLGVLDVEQAGGSVFRSHSLSFGARLARHDIATGFSGEHCETLLNGLYYVNGRRHVDHHTTIVHGQPHGTSREYYRGILADTARGVFTGRILVSPGADGTDAVQRSDSLLLSRMARADARPELEIYADDVKCAHGATVGQIDENSLFYLRSRGLDETHARNLVVYAFAAEALSRIDDETLRRRASTAIQVLLPGGRELGELS